MIQENISVEPDQGIWIERKGQFIVNKLDQIGVSREDVGRYLHGLTDELYEELENKYRKYLLSVIHPSLSKHELESIKKFSNKLKSNSGEMK